MICRIKCQLTLIEKSDYIALKFIPRGLPRDKAMGDYQGGEAQLSPLGETPDEVKNLIIRKGLFLSNM